MDITKSFNEYKDSINSVLSNISDKKLFKVIEMIKISIKNKGKVYIIGNGGSSSIASHVSVDFTTSYQLNENALVYLELNNLTNEPLKYYLGDENRPLQVEYYGVRGMVGINYQF